MESLAHSTNRSRNHANPRATFVGLGVAGSFLLLALVSLGFLLKTYADSNGWVSHTYQVIAGARESLGRLLDIETGVRGYVSTGNAEFLQPYSESKQRIDPILEQLKSLTNDNPIERANFDRLGRLYVDELNLLDQMIAARKSDNLAQAADAMMRGKGTMDQCRAVINSVEAEEHRLLAERQAATERTQSFLLSAVACAAITAIISMVQVILLFRRYTVEINQFTSDLENTGAALQRSNVELQQFAYVASHDLQEPLRAVAGFLRLLERKYKGQLDEQADQWIEFSIDGARRMQVLINDLLELSRVETRGAELTNVSTMEAVELAKRNLVEAIAEADALIECGELPAVVGDLSQLTQLFQNLIGNAIKFRGSQRPRVEIYAISNGDKSTFSIKDNGIGFDMTHVERIFLIFQRLQNRTKYAGTGIGLALCKKIVERHGGKIWADSKVGEGSVFFFTLINAR